MPFISHQILPGKAKQMVKTVIVESLWVIVMPAAFGDYDCSSGFAACVSVRGRARCFDISLAVSQQMIEQKFIFDVNKQT